MSGPFQLRIATETPRITCGTLILSESGVSVRTSHLAMEGGYPLPFSPTIVGAVSGLSSSRREVGTRLSGTAQYI